ncbi:MAG: MlaD family protein [Candidatus Sumerlaeota bacterium]|nr:MlaD family protein [Candidatus Sumerlaeota bacterium]
MSHADDELEEGRRRHTALGLFLSLCVLALILGAVIGFAVWKSRGLNYTLQFKNAAGLGEGDKVTLSGIPIGEVRDVRLVGDKEVLVDVQVDEKYADRVKEGSTALIASPNFPNVSGQKEVEVYNPADETAKRLEDGATIQGQDSLVGLKAWQIKDKLKSAGEGASAAARSLADSVGNMVEELKDIPESPEVKDALEKLNALANDLSVKGKAQLGDLSKRWQDALNSLTPLAQQWSEKGRKSFNKALDAAKEAWQTQGRELRQRLAEKIAPPTSAPAEATATPK